MTIDQCFKENSFAGPHDYQAASAAGAPVFDGAGHPINSAAGSQLVGTGAGSDVTVSLNPDLTLKNPRDRTNPMPNDAVLFHEMNHGVHQMQGTYDGSPVDHWDTQEEKTTISTGNPSEADYLEERRYPWKRTSHGRDWAPNP